MTYLEFGVKNFRKYTTLNPLKLGEITYLVGENNSGKSTFIKGLLLMINNMIKFKDKILYIPFDFNELDSHYSHVNVPTFDSALNRNGDRNEITFSCQIHNADNNEYLNASINIVVGKGLDVNHSMGEIQEVYIFDNSNFNKYCFKLGKNKGMWIESFEPSQFEIEKLLKLQNGINCRLDNFREKRKNINEKYVDNYSETESILDNEKECLDSILS